LTTKWIFRVKEEGKYKARLVVRGYEQKEEIDYEEIYSPVIHSAPLRMFFALAAVKDYYIVKFDIKTAFLYGEIQEDIYMRLPGGFEEEESKICKLKKALYGLKQAGRQWYRTLEGRLQKLGMKPTTADPCVYVTKRGGEILLALVYVDDILIAYRRNADLKFLLEGLQKNFDVKDLGEAHYSLGIEIERGKDYIKVSQTGYINEIIRRFGMENSNPVQTPTDPNVKLGQNTDSEDEESEKRPYRELVGALNYLAVGTRPDVAYIVSSLSQFNSCHEKQHWVAGKRVLRYLKNTANHGIIYRKECKELNGFTDADWASCPLDRRSYTGYAFTLSGGAIDWESRKQRTVALSSTEAEYMSLTEAAKGAMYLRKLLKEIGIYEPNKISISCDNRGAQLLAENAVYHSRSKHIDLRHHFVRDVLKDGLIELKYLRTEDMPADILTKGLPRGKHFRCMDLLGIRRTPTE